MMPAPAAPAAK